MSLPGAIIAFIYGSFLGSFLNVCIYRLPRDESIITPPSYCPQCKARIRWWQNIPLLSYIFLRGRCFYCQKKISFRYFLVEALSGLLTASTYCLYGLSFSFFYYLLFIYLLIVIFFIDLDHQLILDITTIPAMIIGLLGSIYFSQFWSSLLGLLGGGIFFYLIAVVSEAIFHQEAMGGGDVKFAALIGAFLGWKLSIVAFFLAFFIGSVVGIFLIVIKLKGRKDYIPFGPSMALGAFLTLLYGNQLIQWYFSLSILGFVPK